ncbi:MAG: hypothetical protein NBV67_00855 [Tagaea sp.]|nr:hypothetical protein [Tagaea sp.]
MELAFDIVLLVVAAALGAIGLTILRSAGSIAAAGAGVALIFFGSLFATTAIKSLLG